MQQDWASFARKTLFLDYNIKTLKAKVNGIVINLFYRFFAAHPEYQKLFKGFADVPSEKLGENKLFQVRGNK